MPLYQEFIENAVREAAAQGHGVSRNKKIRIKVAIQSKNLSGGFAPPDPL